MSLRSIVDDVALLANDIDPTGLTGELKVGVISTVLSGFMPYSIQHCAEHLSNLSLQILPGTSQQLYQQIITDKIDVAILVQPPFKLPHSIVAQALYSEPLAFISQTKHESLNSAIQGSPFIQYDPQAWGGAIANQYLIDHQLEVTALCEIDALESITLMVKHGMGVSLIPYWQGLTSIADKLQVTLLNNPKYSRQISVLSRRQSAKQPLINGFNEAVQEGIKNHCDLR